jgi:hypothetical protein
MNRRVYFALLALLAVCVGIVNGQPSSGGLILVCVLVAVAVAAIVQVRVGRETQEQEYRRSYEASNEATYIALCGSLGDLGYEITARDPESGKVTFTGGNLGPWIGRLGVECCAWVRQIGDRESQITVAGHASRADKHGWGVLLYPEGMDRRAARILDRVNATVITYSVIDAALAAP